MHYIFYNNKASQKFKMVHFAPIQVAFLLRYSWLFVTALSIIVTVAIVVYRSLIPIVYRILTQFNGKEIINEVS